MRYTDWSAAPKVTAASTPVVWTGTEIPANGVVAYHVELTGAGMTFGDITRIRVKSQGASIIDIDNAHFTAFYQRYSKTNRVLAAADTFFTIPLWIPEVEDEDGDDERGIVGADWSQMPRGGAPTVELQIGAGGAAGTALIGYTVSDRAPKFFPVMLGSSLQIAASNANGKYPLFEQGGIKGFSINTTGLDRVKLVQGGVQKFHSDGVLCQAMQDDRNLAVTLNPIFLDVGGRNLKGLMSAPAGSSFLELATGAGWAGVTNESVIYALRPQ